MPRISFTENLRRHIEVPPTTAEGGTVREALDQVFTAHPRLKSYIVDDQGRVRKHVTIFLNDEMIKDRDRLTDPVTDNDEIYVFQALSGG